ncbi:MAG: MarR family winged helix-turn-helix transcriptional regulator [Fusobacteriaceae bacterium]
MIRRLITIYSLGYDICFTARKIHQNLSGRFKEYNITPEQWVVLKNLREEDKISQKELSVRVEKDPNTVKAIIDKLEKKSYVVREENPHDKRAFLLSLTQAGHEISRVLQPLDDDMLLSMSKTLSEEEIKTFKLILSKIASNLGN